MYTPITNGNTGNATLFNTRFTEIDGNINALIAGTSGLTLQAFALPTTLTLVSDAITVTRTRHLVDTQAAASTDDLSTINLVTSLIPILALSSVSAARVVVVRHNVGNIWLNGENYTLDDPAEVLWLIWNHTLAKWCMFNPPQAANAIPVPGTRGFFMWRASQAAIVATMTATPATTGTLTESMQSDSNYVNFASSATINSLSGAYIVGSLVRRAYDPIIEVVLRTTADISSLRVWVGIFGASGAINVDTQASGSGLIGFRYSTAAGDTGWRPVCNDNSGNQTTGTAIGTVAVSTRYRLRARVDSANGVVYFSVNNSTETTISTNLPPVGTDLGPGLAFYNLVAVTRSIGLSRFYVEQN